MNARDILPRGRRNVIATGLGLVLPLSAMALDSVPPEALSVKVFPDRYVAAGKPFSDLTTMETWAKAIQIRVLWLDSCGPGSTERLLAAVERFHRVYAEGIQIRTLAASEPSCLPAPEVQGSGRDSVKAPIDLAYFATDQYGRSNMP